MENAYVRSGSTQSLATDAADSTGSWKYKDAATMAVQVIAQVYTSDVRQAVATAHQTGGVIDALTIVDGGAGYTAAPTITVTGFSAGSGANITATLSNGVIVGFTINSGGTLYNDPLTVTIGAPYSTVGSTVKIEQSNDGAVVAVTSATVTVSGTTAASGGAVVTGPWKYIRAVVSGTTGATATKTTVIGSV